MEKKGKPINMLLEKMNTMHITNTHHAEHLSTLPVQIFYSTQIPVYLWFHAKNKNNDAERGFRDRYKAVLFISNTSPLDLDQQVGIIHL